MYIYCNNKSRPGFLALEIVYVLKPSGGTDRHWQAEGVAIKVMNSNIFIDNLKKVRSCQ